MEQYPLVSILSTFKDSKDMLKTVIDSVLAQDYPNIEHIIIDSFSKDGSVELLKNSEYQYTEKGYKYIWKSEPDRCIADGANKAASLMTGSYFIFLTNPFVSTGSLSTLMKAMLEDNYDAVCGGVLFHKDGIISRRWRGTKWSWRLGWMAANETLCMKREIFEKYGPYSEKYKASFDYNFQLSLFTDKKLRLKVIQVPIIFFYAGGVSNAGISGSIKTAKEDYTALKSHNVKLPLLTILGKCIAALLAYTFASRKDISSMLP